MSGLGLEDGSREEAVALEVDGDTAELERFRLRDMIEYQCNYGLLGRNGRPITFEC